MYRIFEWIFFSETCIHWLEKPESSSTWFTRRESPIWMKWCICSIDLEMQMWSSSYSCHADTPEHFSFSDLISLGDEDLRKVEICWVECRLCPIPRYIIVTDNDIFVPCGISLSDSYDHSVRYREYWCPDWCSYIDTEMTSVMLFVVQSIASHVQYCIGISEYRCSLWARCAICDWECIIERYREIFADRNVFESFGFILICWFGPVWYIGNRHDRTIEWIWYDLAIRITSCFHIRDPYLFHSDCAREYTVTYPDECDTTREYFWVSVHKMRNLFLYSAS